MDRKNWVRMLSVNGNPLLIFLPYGVPIDATTSDVPMSAFDGEAKAFADAAQQQNGASKTCPTCVKVVGFKLIPVDRCCTIPHQKMFGLEPGTYQGAMCMKHE